jgi:Zn-dependent protease/CBS domain-containing protein
MFASRWRLLRLLGIPVFVDVSWLIILTLLTWTFTNVFRDAVADLTMASYWLLGLAMALVFFSCIVLHELGHAVAARATGVPVRGITLFLFGGVMEMEDEPRSAKGEFLIAIAGPLVTLILALGLGITALIVDNVVAFPPVHAVLHSGLLVLVQINVLILVFNMIPAFPLDGGRVFRSILWGVTGDLRRATYWAALLGQGFAWFLIFVGILDFFAGNAFQGLWFAVIGFFLKDAAQGSYQQVLVRQFLKGEPVSHFMTPNPIAVPPTLDLHHWVEDYVYRYDRKAFPVAVDGRLLGFISTEALAPYPRPQWDRHRVGEIMQPDFKTVSVGPRDDALDALAKMQNTGSSRLLVVEGDRLAGIISLKDLLQFLSLKIELEGGRSAPQKNEHGARECKGPTGWSSQNWFPVADRKPEHSGRP